MPNEKSIEMSQLNLPKPTPEKNLLDLPDELIRQIVKYSKTSDLQKLAQTNKTFYYTYQPELDKRAAKQLMAYVLYPTPENIAKAEAMYSANPRILFIKTQGVEVASSRDDETGQVSAPTVCREIVDCSPFQAVLGTGDSAIYKNMATYFDKIVYKNESGAVMETGVERAQKQIQEKFPNGFDYPPIDADFCTLINEIVTAITNDPMLINDNTANEATQALLAKLRKYFLPKDVTQGHHFNLNYLIKASEVYNQQWASWNGNQLSLFFCQVIGYVERLPAVVDAQAFCQGLYELSEENQPEARSLSLYNYQSSSNVNYHHPRLGFDFGIHVGAFPGKPRLVARGAGFVRGGGAALKNYVEQKQQSLVTLSNMLNSGLTRQPVRNSLK